MCTSKCVKICRGFIENQWSHLPETKNPTKRAGTLLLDEKRKKILLVQTYGSLWGPPKGTLEDNETFINCALRETREETGIPVSFHEMQLVQKIFDKKAWYYKIKADKYRNSVNLSEIAVTEITGVAWVCKECLYSMFESKQTNSHLNHLINYVLYHLK